MENKKDVKEEIKIGYGWSRYKWYGCVFGCICVMGLAVVMFKRWKK